MTPGEAGEVKRHVMNNLSDHPYNVEGKERILRFDSETGILETDSDAYKDRAPFPFYLGKALRKLMVGSRTGGAVIEIGR